MTVPADSHPAFHPPLQGGEDTVRRYSPFLEQTDDKTNHDPRAADQGHVPLIHGQVPQKFSDQPDPSVPLRCSLVNGQPQINTLPPAVKVTGKTEIINCSAAVAQGYFAESVRLQQGLFNDRPQGRKTDTTGNNNQVLPGKPVHGERVAVRPPDADNIADL